MFPICVPVRQTGICLPVSLSFYLCLSVCLSLSLSGTPVPPPSYVCVSLSVCLSLSVHHYLLASGEIPEGYIGTCDTATVGGVRVRMERRNCTHAAR